jgi:hypothetical protein
MDYDSDYSTDTEYINCMSCYKTFELDESHDGQDYCPDCNNIVEEHYQQEYHAYLFNLMKDALNLQKILLI